MFKKVSVVHKLLMIAIITAVLLVASDVLALLLIELATTGAVSIFIILAVVCVAGNIVDSMLFGRKGIRHSM